MPSGAPCLIIIGKTDIYDNDESLDQAALAVAETPHEYLVAPVHWQATHCRHTDSEDMMVEAAKVRLWRWHNHQRATSHELAHHQKKSE
jgi:hypothetical protein